MLVHRLMWPLLERRFRDPKAPRWFHARVRAHLLATAPMPRRVWDILLTPAPAFIIGGSFAAYSWTLCLVLALMWGMILLPLLLAQDIVVARRLVASGADTYAQAVVQVRDHLTGHERLCYAQRFR